jgi:hypothetical protein
MDLKKNITNAVSPLGLAIWMAFVIPMLLVNFMFMLQSLSDPFGWGWNLLGFAGLPWHQVIPEAIPWIQVLLVIAGILLSIRNLDINFEQQLNRKTAVQITGIIGTLFCLIGLGMVLFYSAF